MAAGGQLSTKLCRFLPPLAMITFYCTMLMVPFQAEKLRGALRVHLPPGAPAADVAAFLDGLMAHLSASWSLTLTPAALERVDAEPNQAPAAAAAPAGEAGSAKEAGAPAAAAVAGGGAPQPAAPGTEGQGEAAAVEA